MSDIETWASECIRNSFFFVGKIFEKGVPEADFITYFGFSV